MSMRDEFRRRVFLKYLGAGIGTSVAGLSLTGCSGGSNSFSGSGGDSVTVRQPASQRVIIIGAGASGLTAANALSAAGVDTVVLEARDRIGGRVWTDDVGGVPVDLGGMWIHGAEGNPAACILNHEGIDWRPAPFFTTATRLYDSALDRYLTTAETQLVVNSLFEFPSAVDELMALVGPETTVKNALTAYLENKGYTGVVRRHAEFGIAVEIELQAAQSLSDISLASFVGVEDDSPGNEEPPQEPGSGDDADSFPDGSYRALINALARGVNVQLETVVTRVVYDENGVSVETNRGTEQGSHVIVTVPLAVLKQRTITFSPPLPEDKLAAIDLIGIAELEKVVLRYDEAFWQANAPNNLLHIAATLGELPLMVDYTPFAGGSPTIVAFYCGDWGRQAQAMSDAELVQQANGIVNAAAGGTDRQPIASQVTRWKDDPYAMGSYPTNPVRASVEEERSLPQRYRALAEPIGERVLFAGDGTDYNLGSTVEGAVASGIREAERILERIGEGVILDSGLLVHPGCDETV